MFKFSKILIPVFLALFMGAGFGISHFSKAEITNNPINTASDDPIDNTPDNEGAIYICPNATSLEEINPLCPGITVLNLGETINGMTLSSTTYDDKEYYIVYGFENGGGGEFGAVEESIKNLDDYIENLRGDSFKSNSAQRKNALHNKLQEVFLKIEAQEYQEAINKLQNDIRSKADGFVDGNSKNDWIVDPTAQGEICVMIDNLIYYLRSLY